MTPANTLFSALWDDPDERQSTLQLNGPSVELKKDPKPWSIRPQTTERLFSSVLKKTKWKKTFLSPRSGMFLDAFVTFFGHSLKSRYLLKEERVLLNWFYQQWNFFGTTTKRPSLGLRIVSFFLKALDAGYGKLLKYFNKYERNPAYRRRCSKSHAQMEHVQKMEPQDRITAKNAMVTSWQTKYNTSSAIPAQTASMSSPQPAFEAWDAELLAAEDDDMIKAVGVLKPTVSAVASPADDNGRSVCPRPWNGGKSRPR